MHFTLRQYTAHCSARASAAHRTHATATPCSLPSLAASTCNTSRAPSRLMASATPSDTSASGLTAEDKALLVVDRQLRLYNARQVEPFLEVFTEDITASDAVTGTVLASSKTELRPRYVERFKTPVHCELIGRLALGNVVVDREIITGLPDNGVAECMATYVVDTEAMKIRKMQFVWKPRTFGVKL